MTQIQKDCLLSYCAITILLFLTPYVTGQAAEDETKVVIESHTPEDAELFRSLRSLMSAFSQRAARLAVSQMAVQLNQSEREMESMREKLESEIVRTKTDLSQAYSDADEKLVSDLHNKLKEVSGASENRLEETERSLNTSSTRLSALERRVILEPPLHGWTYLNPSELVLSKSAPIPAGDYTFSVNDSLLPADVENVHYLIYLKSGNLFAEFTSQIEVLFNNKSGAAMRKFVKPFKTFYQNSWSFDSENIFVSGENVRSGAVRVKQALNRQFEILLYLVGYTR